MRRVMLLALLTLVLPTAALANSISSINTTENVGYVCSPSIGICVIGTGTTPSFMSLSSPFHVTLAGTTPGSSIMITGVQLSPSPCGTIQPSQTCTFTGGEITIEAGAVKEVFPIESGSLTIQGASVRRITNFQAVLAPNGNVTFLQPFEWNGTGKVFTDGSIQVNEPSVVPEPGTREGLLFGMGVIGLIGLAGMTRRKRTVTPDLATCC